MDESKAQTHSSDHDEWANVKIRHAYHELPGHFYSAVTPSPLDNPAWVHWNADMAQQLGLPRIASPQLLQQFAGKNAHPYLKPIATKYVGHQFGYYNPDLGDGRGLLLGELYHQTEKQWYEMHVKGSGPTPYSRGADGRAVLRSSIREYLISEALHHLGIPTTRALGLITSETQVYRDGIENGAICIRLAPSHIRFGHFEHFYQQKDHDGLKALLDFCIAHYFPECQKAQVPYAAFFKTVCDKTAELIANWQAFGFAHGVLNTDNMSILSLSFDFGPFAFLDGYQSDFICNHSDSQGRYSFANQPAIGQWNLQVLAQALSPFIDIKTLQHTLEGYQDYINAIYLQKMSEKLGFEQPSEGIGTLIAQLLTILEQESTDYTRFFRQLSCLDSQSSDLLFALFIDSTAIKTWFADYQEKLTQLGLDFASISPKMRRVNPKYILRNYLLELAIQRAQLGEFDEVDALFKLIQNPYDEQPEFEKYARLPPDWAKHLNLSCSS